MKVLKPFKIGDTLVPIGNLTICQFMFLLNEHMVETMIEKGYLEAVKSVDMSKEITLL